MTLEPYRTAAVAGLCSTVGIGTFFYYPQLWVKIIGIVVFLIGVVNTYQLIRILEKEEKNIELSRHVHHQQLKKYFIIFFMGLFIFIIPSVIISGLFSGMIYVISLYLLINAIYFEHHFINN